MRRPLKTQIANRGQSSRDGSFPAPVGGWNTRDSQAQMNPRYALYMENLFPTAKTVQLRKGCLPHATALPSEAQHLMAWRGLTDNNLFACTDDGIFDVSSAGAVGAASTPCTNGYCQHVNFNTTGGSFLVVVNGTDDLQYYDGSSWTGVASFPIGGGGTLNTADISFINNFKRSLYFIKKDTLEFYYLPIDQITGTVGYFPLGALFSKGGKLVAIGNWTFDGGVGLDDYTVFATSEGQLAVYKGTDPNSDTTWALQGVYDLGKPLGPNCFTKYGGDLLYMSTSGLISMAQGLVLGTVKEQGAVSDIIKEAFGAAASQYGDNLGWQVILSPLDSLLIVNVPLTTLTISEQYVMNLDTKAWCKFTAWDAMSWELWNDQLYMSVGNEVQKAWVGGLDIDESITAYCKQAPIYLPPRSRLKQVQLVRPLMEVQGIWALNAMIDVDFQSATDYLSPAYNGLGADRWDSAVWDTATWGEALVVDQDWITVACDEGYCQALRLRLITRNATIEWSSVDYIYMAGVAQG